MTDTTTPSEPTLNEAAAPDTQTQTPASDTAPAEQGFQAEGVSFEDGDGFTFDMEATEESSGFDPLPKGMYDCVIDQVEFRISKSSGSPMWSITLAIESGEFAEKNRKLFTFVSLKAEQQGRVKQFINRVAPELSKVKAFNPKKVAEDGLLVGKRLRAKVDIENSEEYGARNRVRDMLAPVAGGGSGGFSL